MCGGAGFKRFGGPADTADGKLAGAAVSTDTGSAGTHIAISAYLGLSSVYSVLTVHRKRRWYLCVSLHVCIISSNTSPLRQCTQSTHCNVNVIATMILINAVIISMVTELANQYEHYVKSAFCAERTGEAAARAQLCCGLSPISCHATGTCHATHCPCRLCCLSRQISKC